MAEGKSVKLNLRKEMKNIPKWKRRAVFARLIRKKLKNKDMKISQKLNEKLWSVETPKVRIKIVKDDKTTKAEFVE